MSEHTKEVVANLLCYLIDNHENEPLSEDALQQIGVKFLADEQYRVVINHTDPTEKETALCLKYRQRAREAEAASEVEDAKNNVMYTALEKLACLGNGDYYGSSNGNVIAQDAIAGVVAIADKFMEDVLMPDKGETE